MATYTIDCCGKKHRIKVDDDKQLFLLDCDIEEQETLEAMGLETSDCYMTYSILRTEPEVLLQNASHHGQIESIKLALAFEVDVNTRFCSPITLAAEEGHAEAIKLLAKHGANVNGCEGRPLRRAAESGHLDAVKALVSLGADIHHLYEGALYSAAQNKQASVVKYLLQQGASIDLMLSADKRYLLAACNDEIRRMLYDCEEEVSND